MTQNQLIEWAIKGIDAEIEKLEKQANKGRQLLLQLDKGEKISSPMTANEIRQVIAKHTQEIERLAEEKFALKWQIVEGEE